MKNSHSESYAAAGVDVTAGYESVDAHFLRIEHAAAESNHITAQVNDGDHHPVAEVVIAGSAAVFIAAARKVGVYKFRFGIALLPHVTQEPIPSVRRTAKPKMADYFRVEAPAL